MNIRSRRTPRPGTLLLAFTVPLTGYGLLTQGQVHAIAQAVNPNVPHSDPLPTNDPTDPSASPAPLPAPARAPKPAKAPKTVTPRKPRNGKTAPTGTSTEPPAPTTGTGSAVVAPVPAVPAAPAAPYTGPRIGQIIITGNKTLSQAAVTALSRHQEGDPCNDQTLREIKDNLSQSGFFGAEHNPDNPEDWVKVHSEEDAAHPGTCRVVIEVDENDPIKTISITGSGPVKVDDIAALLHARAGAVYNFQTFRRDLDDIQRLYVSRGYSAEFLNSAGPDANGVLNVPIQVVRVAEIRILKNKKTKRFVILREIKTRQGDYFNRDIWNRDRVRLYNLDLFDEITPSDELIAPGQLRLTLNLVEKRTGSISLGAGYSSRQQLVGRAEVSENNFRGRAETLNLLLETGGIANRSTVELGFTEPYLDKKHTALTVQVYDKTVYRFANSLSNGTSFTGGGGGANVGTDTHYNEQRVGATVTVSRPIRDTYRASLTARGENVRTDPLALSGYNASIIQDGPIYSLGGSLLHDTRDLILDPIKGGYQSLTMSTGYANLKPPTVPAGLAKPQGIYGSVNFSKVSLEARQFFSLQGARRRDKPDEEKRSVALRLLIGASVGTLPFFEQYFVGGAETLRGYREDRFWGSNLMLGSIELRQPLARGLKGVLFSDIGDAWGGKYQGVNIDGFKQGGFKPHASVGLGIRVRTPLGPIRLDYGIGDEGGRTHFSIGNVF